VHRETESYVERQNIMSKRKKKIGASVLNFEDPS
jgi:hypothetical protein